MGKLAMVVLNSITIEGYLTIETDLDGEIENIRIGKIYLDELFSYFNPGDHLSITIKKTEVI